MADNAEQKDAPDLMNTLSSEINATVSALLRNTRKTPFTNRGFPELTEVFSSMLNLKPNPEQEGC